MATLADSLVTTITTEWGNGGGGGAAPTIAALVDYRKDIAPTTEQIVIRLPIYADRRPINDLYANVTHKVLIRVKTTTSDTRLYEIVDELRWIMNNVAVTGINRQFCSGGEDKTDSSRQIFIYDMRVTCEEHVASSATAYSAGTSANIHVTGDLQVDGSFSFDTGENVDVILDEDNMASDDEDALATQQSIKAYVDAVILTEDTLAEMNDTTIAGLADNDVLTYDSGTSKWINENDATIGGDITVGGDLTATGNDIKGSDGTQITMSANGISLAGNIGIGGTAPSATYGFYQTGSGGKYFNVKSTDNTSTFIFDGGTGKDATIVLRENGANKMAIFNDASLNKTRLYNYTSTDAFDLLDAGGVKIYSTGSAMVSYASNFLLDLSGNFYIRDVDDGNATLLNFDTGGRTLAVGIAADPIATTFYDTNDTITVANIADLLMFGSANTAWINCPYEDAYTYDRINIIDGWLTNTGVNNPTMSFGVPLPCNKGGLKLYISGVRIGVGDADADAYITNTYLYGFSGATRTQLDLDATDHNSAGEKEDTFTAVDCSGQTAIKVVLAGVVDAAGELDIGYVAVQAYYAA